MDLLQTLSLFGGSGGIFGAIVLFFKILTKFRRTPELNRHTAAQTESINATTLRLLVEPLERRVIERDDEIERLKDLVALLRRLLRRLLHHHDDVIDAAIVEGVRADDLPPMDDDLRDALDRETE